MSDTQMNMFDAPEGERRRDEAMAAGLRKARESWRAAALNSIQVCALRYDTFTTDQVELVMHESHVKMPLTGDMRALGGLMRKAQHNGWIAPTDRVKQSALPQNHRRPKRVWRSTIRDRR